MARQTIPVSTRALIQRINRALAREHYDTDIDGRRYGTHVVRATRGERARQELGDYYMLELSRNLVLDTRLDLEDLGKELGALRPYERLEE